MIARGAAVLLAIVAGCAPRSAPAAPHPTTHPTAPAARPSPMTSPGYPNVHARLRLTQRAEDKPRVFELELWLKGQRFHVRDLAGRRLDEILGDLIDPRQLGALPRTIEDMMDRDTADRARAARPSAPTELYGDLASDAGRVLRPSLAPAEMRARKLAPTAEQILARGRMVGLQVGATATRLGRDATEYHGFVTIHADGRQYDNEVTRVIAAPYLLLEITRSAGGGLSYTREVLALDEGVVTDADVAPP